LGFASPCENIYLTIVSFFNIIKSMKKIIFLLFVFFVCNTFIFAQEGEKEIKYIARITNDVDDGANLKLSMRTEKYFPTGGYTIELQHKDYGHFHIFAPFVQWPSGLTTQAFSPARVDLSLKKVDSYHFVFFLDEIKEEFLITVENGIIKVKPLSNTKYITFEQKEIRVFPENTLTIMMRFDSLAINKAIKEKLSKNGCEPLILQVGDYGFYKVLAYSKNDKYAHISSRDENKFYYYYEIKNNYEKIENILKENKLSEESPRVRYEYYYNFDIKKRIENENNPGFVAVPMEKIPEHIREPYMQSQRSMDAIIFHLDKPASVTIKINNTEGEKMEEIKMDIESAGTINFKWDGILKDGTKAKKGLYLYQVLLGEKTLRTGFFSLK